MLAMVTFYDTRGGYLGNGPRFLCETHARETCAVLGARWPEPHEGAAQTRHRDGSRTSVKLIPKGVAEACDDCNEPTAAQLLEAQGRA